MRNIANGKSPTATGDIDRIHESIRFSTNIGGSMSQLTFNIQRPDGGNKTATSRKFGLDWDFSRSVWNALTSLSIVKALRDNSTPAASDGASDLELEKLAGPLGRLGPEDVRWDLIGTSCGGRRHRI